MTGYLLATPSLTRLHRFFNYLMQASELVQLEKSGTTERAVKLWDTSHTRLSLDVAESCSTLGPTMISNCAYVSVFSRTLGHAEHLSNN